MIKQFVTAHVDMLTEANMYVLLQAFCFSCLLQIRWNLLQAYMVNIMESVGLPCSSGGFWFLMFQVKFISICKHS